LIGIRRRDHVAVPAEQYLLARRINPHPRSARAFEGVHLHAQRPRNAAHENRQIELTSVSPGNSTEWSVTGMSRNINPWEGQHARH